MSNQQTTKIMGTCPVCHHVIVLDYRDKIHHVGHCTGCGLEYGNPMGLPAHSAPKKVLTDIEVHRMLNEAYGQLVEHEPRLKASTVVTCMNKVAVRMTGHSVPDIPIWKLSRWGYDVVAGYITRRESGES